MLVTQLRDEATVQRQNEIHCAQSRHEALLRALFQTTLATLEINQVKQPQNNNLISFLEANNIVRGRQLDQSCLPPTDFLLQDVNAPPTDPSETQQEPNGGRELAKIPPGDPSKEGDHALICPDEQSEEPNPASTPLLGDESASSLTNGLRTSKDPVERPSDVASHDLKPVRRLDSLGSAADLAVGSILPEEPGHHPPKSVPLSSDGAGFTQQPVLEEIVGEQRSEDTRNVELTSKETHEARSEYPDKKMGGGEDKKISLSNRDLAVTHNLSSPTSEEDGGGIVSEGKRNQGDGKIRSTGILKSHVDLATTAAFGGLASTPDEQLRLEEAQSLQQPKASNDGAEKNPQSMPLHAGLSSEFIHDTMVGGDALPDVSNVGEEGSAKQEAAARSMQSKLNDFSEDHPAGLHNHMLPGVSGEPSRDLTLSRRPPMRIDTGIVPASETPPLTAAKSHVAIIPPPSESSTSRKGAPAVGYVQSPPERMTTRVSSGALRQKSISEILGETPKMPPIQADKNSFAREPEDMVREEHQFLQTPKSASSFTSPDPITFKQRLGELKEKERSRLSTVVFASSRNSDAAQAQSLEDEILPQNRDYLLTLFNFQAASPPKALPLSTLVKSSHKTLSTADHLTTFYERQACQILTLIYDLQSKHRWSLRQYERSVEPTRPITHQDVLLGEMRWMRTDFIEERKWRMAAAQFTAEACAAWVAGDLEERKSLQVKVRAKPPKGKLAPDTESTPELVQSGDDETSEVTDDECIHDPGCPPAAMFSLPPDMFIFGLNRSPMAEKLLLELPLYQPNTEYQDAALLSSQMEPDATWKHDIVPVSKYAQGKIVSASKFGSRNVISADEGPPLKRSRYNYEQVDIRQPDSQDLPHDDLEKTLEPEQDDIALFDPEFKHIRDRIHTGHAFRPPSEFVMPSQSFFESRLSSQWTQAEDDELRRIVKEYSYNWSLISSSMTFPSMFSSGAERRTPWECFERWISLEGLPVEMAKINYFRAYHQRLQNAQKTVENTHFAQQQQPGSSAPHLPMRRRTTQPYSVERRKEQRHLHMVDAMRKLAKKRETAVNKQQHNASLAAMRKAQEGPKARKEMHTPQEFSRLKYNQQMKLEEQAKHYRAQMLQHQKAAQATKANQQASQQANGMPPTRNSVPGGLNGSSPNLAGGNPHSQMRGAAGDPSRAVPHMQRIANGQTNGVLPHSSHGVPHAPMQPNNQVQMQLQQRMAPGMVTDARILQEASRVQAQQAYQQQIRQQSHPLSNGHAGSPNMQNPGLHTQNNATMLAPIRGRSSPSVNGVPPLMGSSTSPRMTQPQALSSGMTPAVSQISSQVKARHPQASAEQITRMTTDQLYKMSEANVRQHAMQAAAGNANMNAVANNNNIGLQATSPMQQAAIMANGGNSISSAQYAQIMRNQQASQQRSASGAGGQGTNSSGINGTTINGSQNTTSLMQRTPSAQGAPRMSQSPSTRPVGLAQ